MIKEVFIITWELVRPECDGISHGIVAVFTDKNVADIVLEQLCRMATGKAFELLTMPLVEMPVELPF